MMASVRDTNLKLYKAAANPGHFCQQFVSMLSAETSGQTSNWKDFISSIINRRKIKPLKYERKR